jgi:hypothetical protein
VRTCFVLASLSLAAAQGCWARTPAEYDQELLGPDETQLERMSCGTVGLKAKKITGHSTTPDIDSIYGAHVECVPSIRDRRSIQYFTDCGRDGEKWQCEPLSSITYYAMQFGNRTLWARLQGDLSRRTAQAAFSFAYRKVKAGHYLGRTFEAGKFQSPCWVRERSNEDVDIVCNGLPVTVHWDASRSEPQSSSHSRKFAGLTLPPVSTVATSRSRNCSR